MIRRLPLVPTLVVLAAVAVMIGLGIWQLQRAAWKDALLARYEQAMTANGAVAFPLADAEREGALYRRSSIDCDAVLSQGAIAGRNASGESGWAQTARCALPGGATADIVLGWSRDPRPVAWAGGRVTGYVAPGRGEAVRLIADPPRAGLGANARPDPRDIPNNHIGYAGQWFFFALSALVIYWLALRRRLAPGGAAR